MSGEIIYQVRIKPMEPLLLRGPGEFDPSARGVSSSAISQTWPSPSTITGLLTSLLLQQLQPPVQSWSDYVKRMHGALDQVDIKWVRGPYFVRGSTHYVPLRIGGELYIVNLNQLREYFKENLEGIKDSNQESFDNLKERLLQSEGGFAKSRVIERIGIALTTREGVKTVSEGYLYTATYVALDCDWIGVEVGATPSILRLENVATALGGEQRIARLEVAEPAENAMPLASMRFTGGYALLLSPLVVAQPMRIVRSGEGVQAEMNKTPIFKLVLGAAGLVGLGFSIAERSRKPVYPAVLEGSIIKFSKCCSYTEDLGAYACIPNPPPLLGLLGRIGYGSLVTLMTEE
ncbi:MAG: type III-B CRISPR module-associated Cmr3 family protein [Thermofilaceae archaeon]